MSTKETKLALIVHTEPGDSITEALNLDSAEGLPRAVRRQLRRVSREQTSLYSFIGSVPPEDWVIEEGRPRLTLPRPAGRVAARQELDRSGTVTGAAIALHMMRYPDKVYTVKAVSTALRMREEPIRRVMDKLAENGLIAAERRKIPGRKPTRCYWIPFKQEDEDNE